MSRKFEILALLFVIAGSPCAVADDTATPGGRLPPVAATAQVVFEQSDPRLARAPEPPQFQPWLAGKHPVDALARQEFTEWFRRPQGTTYLAKLPDVEPAVAYRDPDALLDDVLRETMIESSPRPLSPITVQPQELPQAADARSDWGDDVVPIVDPLAQDDVPPALERLPVPDAEFPETEVMPGWTVLPESQLLPELSRWPVQARVGWWSTSTKGSPIKVGEYQSLASSLFWDVDRISSDGLRTIDLSLTGLDKEANQAGLRYIGPYISADLDYQRFLRRFDRDTLDAFVDFDQQPVAPLPPAPGNFRDMKEDLTVGEDFAIRVQELDGQFKGQLTNNVSWKLNFWGLRKRGQRQVTAFAHCYTAPNATDVNGNPVGGIACHVFSQTQRIDWLTMEVEPVVAAQLGPVSVEYSRTMRALTTDDELTTRPYDNLGFNGDLPYAVVPENFTQIDRLKLGVRFADRRSAYARLFIGNTDNEHRDTRRRFRGYDVRLTDRSWDGISLTAYANNYRQEGSRPAVLLPLETAANVRTPIGYDRTALGFRARWQPFAVGGGTPYYRSNSLSNGFSLMGGYEYRELNRSNALFAERALTVEQARTRTNVAHIRAAMRWSPRLDSYVGYRVSSITDPLYGVPIGNTTVNSNLPTERHLIDFGTTWTPTDALMLSATFGFNNSGHYSEITSFEEDDFNVALTGWYTPIPRWTVSGGLAFYSNWIDQDITLGSKVSPFTSPWSFTSRSDVINFGMSYAWTPRTTLSGGYEFVRGSNLAVAPLFYSDIPPLSNVVVEISRFNLGVDYRLQEGIACFFRYEFFDFEDRSRSINNGTVDMLLFGVDGRY